MTAIQYQDNGGVLLALLPKGRVEFLDRRARPFIDAVNGGRISAHVIDWNIFVVEDLAVDLDQFHLAAPAIVFLEVTNECNLRCDHCYVSSGVKRRNEMDTEEILGVLDTIAAMGTLQIFLTGGELFMRPDVVEIITHARKQPFFTQVFTNGLLITEEHLKQIPAPTSFNISFDTADPVRTVRGGLDYPKLREVFDMMYAHGHFLRTALSIHRQNQEDALQIFAWCAENGYPRPQWSETHLLGRAVSHPDILMLPGQVERSYEIYQQCMDMYSETPHPESDPALPQDRSGVSDDPDSEFYAVDTVRFAVRLEKATRREKCGRSVAYINASGDVFPCTNCQAARMYKAGNVRDTSFQEIWENGFSKWRTISFDDWHECASCPVQQAGVDCQFRCPPLSRTTTGNDSSCSASPYMKDFMLRTHAYWETRREEGATLSLMPPPPRRRVNIPVTAV